MESPLSDASSEGDMGSPLSAASSEGDMGSPLLDDASTEGDMESRLLDASTESDMDSSVSDALATGDMESPLLDAATLGDVNFLRRLYHDNRKEDQSLGFLNYSDYAGRNLLHMAMDGDRYTFLFEALNVLSSNPTLLIELICQKADESVGSPVHRAAQHGNIFILKLLVNAYNRAVSNAENNQETPPWLKRDYRGFTPLRQTLKNEMPAQETIARYLVSADEHFYRTLGQSKYPMDKCSTEMLDLENTSIVFIGMQIGFSQLVKQILTSDLPYALNGDNNETPLHYASKCNEQVSRILLEKHPEIIRNVSSSGKTMLDHAVEDNATWLVRLMLIEKEEARVPWTKACRKLIWHINQNGDTPLHIAARNGNIEILELLIQGYKFAREEETKYCDEPDALPESWNDNDPWYDGHENDILGANLFHVGNSEDDIPLILALRNKYDDCGLILSNETFPTTPDSNYTSIYKKSLPIAVQNGCLLSAKKILESVILSSYVIQELEYRLIELDINSPIALGMAIHITNTYPVMQEMVKAKEFEKFLEVLPMFMGENQKDSETILREAVEKGDELFVRLILQISYDIIRECASAWQVACEKGNLPFILIFIELCDHGKFIEFFRETKQTPLHHIQLLQYEQYIKLLNKPVFKLLIGEGDFDGATPLHKAILRGDLELTKALLSVCNSEIKLSDNSSFTAFDLLGQTIDLSTSWRELYVEVLKMPKFEKLLNARNLYGTTPLHRAIECCNLEVTKALLTFNYIDITINDNDGKTAIDLLEQMVDVSQSWLELYAELLKTPGFEELLKQRDKDGTTPLHRAIQRDNLELTNILLETKRIDVTIRDNKDRTPLDLLQKSCAVSPSWRELYVEVLKTPKFRELLNARNSFGTTPLHRAIEGCNLEVTKALLTFDDIDITIKDDNGKTAIDLLEQMVDVSPSWLEVYIELLKKPVLEKLINERDEHGTTPLHRAIQRDNLELTNVLLETKGIDVTMKDNKDRTPLDLLQKSCAVSPSWGKMCRDIKQDSTVRKLKYLFRKIAFEGMQNTISVVAFSVSNTIAMCCSIMVLFILLGPMMWDPHPSLVYVNLSLTLLLMSLVGTIVAFMTGVYATMAPKAMWDSIFVIVSCSLALIMACIILLLTYSVQTRELLDKLFNRVKNTSQKSARSSSTLVAETSSSPQAEHGIDLDGEADSII